MDEHVDKDLVFHPETLLRFDLIDEGILKTRKIHNYYLSLVGTWQSHLQIYFLIRDKVLETGIDGPVLILEDDIRMERRLPYAVKENLELLPSDWDLFFIGSTGAICIETINENLCRGENIFLASSYLVNGLDAARKLIYLSNTMFVQIADHIWYNFFQGDIRGYFLLNNMLAEQNRNLFEPDYPDSVNYNFYKLQDPVI